MSDYAISVQGISKRYRVRQSGASSLFKRFRGKSAPDEGAWALQDISFNVGRGEAVAIIGRNGGGKSTLLEILTGTLSPSSGSVKVNGRVAALLELGSGFNPEYSGRDNVMLNGLLLGLTREEILGRFSEIEAFAEIGAAIDRPVKTYSSGMLMRLAFAVQVLARPDILIVDEALGVGDFFFQQKCLDYIKRLLANGTTLLFVSHDMGTVRDICQRVIYLKKGELIFDGATNDGVALYFREASAPAVETESASPRAEMMETEVHADIIRDAIWTSNTGLKDGALVAVALYDEHGCPTTGFRMATKMKLRALFAPAPNVANHISVALFDKFRAVRSATGSVPLRIAGANYSQSMVEFELDISLMLEAGEYGILVNLGHEQSKNRGLIIDETPMLGPIQIKWDYENEVAPFLGQVGLPASGRFISCQDIRRD
ncbi:ABC transporter related (ATPase component) protein [Herbaspirillum rubrisubalbicans M1]|uniref:ABC transporter ATP-binding protein n=1 Tax=Herbaspirillum rubrisubalbicans TaxID=80842 RepID=UPI00073A3418|nr:ABC transporter ATP-binding protein [Herbaspirillum rubrisubalbicans]ALU87684.1 ABC transporter related (ATPase component) protein [Herbaspirillum rubrisubalbicans M1]